MPESRRISLVITTYNEFEKFLLSFELVIDDPRIAEIVICDDHSNEEIAWKIQDWLEFDVPELHSKEKIKLCHNTKHIGEHLNQHTAVLMADSEYVLLIESKHIITPQIIDGIFNQDWENLYRIHLSDGGVFLNRSEFLRNFKVE